MLWLLILIGYILHPQFYLSGLFYGVDIKLKDSTGKEPASSHIMHILFDILPMAIILLSMYLTSKIYRVILLTLTILFLIANGAHFIETIKEDAGSISQIILIGFIFIFNLLLFVEALRWWRDKSGKENAVLNTTKNIQKQ